MSGALSMLRRVGAPCLIFAAAFLTFLPALNADFVDTWDDYDNVVNNTGVHGLRAAQLRWMWTGTVGGHWIPLTWMSFGLNYALDGVNPRGYHLLNLLLHAAGATVFFFIVRRLLRAAGSAAAESDLSVGAAFAALLFAVHPLRVESVVWVTERKDVLCGFFFMLAVLAYLRAAGGATLRRGWTYASLAATAAALLSKAAALPLPAVLLLLDVYPLGRVRIIGWRRCLLEKLPWAAVAAIGAFIALRVVLMGNMVTGYETYGPGSRVAMTAYTFSFYPARWLWPLRLIPLYELPVEVHLLAPRFLIPALAFVAVTALLFALRRIFPAGLAAWTLSVLMLLPISGIVHSGHQLAHDRYSYLSGLGFAVLAGAALGRVLSAGHAGRLRPPIVALLSAVALLVVGTWGAESWRQSRVWHDSETLWRWALDVDPACALCHNNLGSVILETPPFDPVRAALAESHFREAIRLHPERPNAYQNLGAALASQKRYPEAEVAFREFMRKYPEAVSGPGSLGVLLMEQGRYADAVPLLRQAHGMQPEAPELRVALGAALRARAAELGRQGKRDEAAALLKEAAAVEPGAQRSTTSAR